MGRSGLKILSKSVSCSVGLGYSLITLGLFSLFVSQFFGLGLLGIGFVLVFNSVIKNFLMWLLNLVTRPTKKGKFLETYGILTIIFLVIYALWTIFGDYFFKPSCSKIVRLHEETYTGNSSTGLQILYTYLLEDGSYWLSFTPHYTGNCIFH